MVKEINRLKKEKNAVIMAHYYVADEIQDIADFIGDSFFLARKATETDADIIVLCGVRFMGESAKVLNPSKKVLIPDLAADCPMAHMATTDGIAEVREKYDDVAVVCYVNSTADLKAASDVCVTSANALKIVSRLPQKNIYFIPNEHRGFVIGLPEKGILREVLSSDDVRFGGSGLHNVGLIKSRNEAFCDQSYSAQIDLPPLSTVYFEYIPERMSDKNEEGV